MKKIRNAIASGFKWNKAVNLFYEEKYDEAIEQLHNLPTDNRLGVEIYLMLGVCHLKLNQEKLANWCFNQSKQNLDKLKEKFSAVDFLYLEAFMYIVMYTSKNNLVEGFYLPPDWNRINLKTVSKHYLHKYPLRDHPDWAEP